jgi:hypothetical protein
LLVFGDKIVHVGFGFSELHLVHALTSVPMEESLAPEHGGELLWDTLEDLLDSSSVEEQNISENWKSQLKKKKKTHELPMKVAAILSPLGGMSQTAVFTLFGIHSTKYEEFLFWTFNICSSTSFMDMRPRKMAATVK